MNYIVLITFELGFQIFFPLFGSKLNVVHTDCTNIITSVKTLCLGNYWYSV